MPISNNPNDIRRAAYKEATTTPGQPGIVVLNPDGTPITVAAGIAGDVNLDEVGGAPFALGQTTKSGSIPVTLPSDQTVSVTLTPNTTGGWSTFLATSSDGSTALTATAQVIKGSAGTFGGYYIYNPNAAAMYVHVYNVAAASVTVGTTNPQNTFCIPGLSGANLELTNGINYSTAMSCAATTTGGGNTAPGTALEANFWFK